MLDNRRYAIIDVETTGGNPRRDRITEVAIYLHDGRNVIDSFTSLVNPGVFIPYEITRITGIDNEMVRSAPKFHEVARRIVEITENAVFVAHNVRFDYGFIQQAFRDLGYTYSRKQLCTVRLSRKAIPGLRSYSLKNLCKHLKIKNEAAHRAWGDATATVKLFEHIIMNGDFRAFPKILKESIHQVRIPPRLKPDILETLPIETGVYYFHGKGKRILYVGKSNNIRKRITSHFSNSHKAMRFMRMSDEIRDISYVLTGSELIALLLENEEIKSLQPKFNRAQRRTRFMYGLYLKANKAGYYTLYTDRLEEDSEPLIALPLRRTAEAILEKRLREFNLCPKLCGLESPGSGPCFKHQLHICDGACVGIVSVEDYNARVMEAVSGLGYDRANFYVIGRGRNEDERSVVLIKKGLYRGYGYFDYSMADAFGDQWEMIESAVDVKKETPDVQKIIQQYIRKNPKEVFMRR